MLVVEDGDEAAVIVRPENALDAIPGGNLSGPGLWDSTKPCCERTRRIRTCCSWRSAWAWYRLAIASHLLLLRDADR